MRFQDSLLACFIVLFLGSLTSCHPIPDDQRASGAGVISECGVPANQWTSTLSAAGPEMPKINLELVGDRVNIDPGSEIGSLGWRQTLLTAKSFNPKPFLVVHLHDQPRCAAIRNALQAISNIYECNNLKCVVIGASGFKPE